MSASENRAQLKISLSIIDKYPLVLIEGECDAFSAPFTHGAINGLIDAGHRGIVVDISHLNFLDVAGFHALDDCCIRMAEANGKILLVSPTKYVKQIYDILRVRVSCSMATSIEEALSRLHAASSK